MKTQASFADESWGSDSWAEHIVLAHVNINQNLDWFYEVLRKLKDEHSELKEFKARSVIDLMGRLDVDTRRRIWQKIRDTVIVIQDPKKYVRDCGLSILPDGSLRLLYEGKELVIGRDSPHYRALNEHLQEQLSDLILIESPLTKISFSLNEMPLLRPRADFFSPEHILSLIGKKDSKKKVMGVIKLAAKLCSAFIEVIHPDATKRILDQFYSYGSDFLSLVPLYHREILKQAVASDRFFDEGHEQSTDIIKQCFDVIEDSLTYSEDESEPFQRGKVAELDSKESIHIQACDWASGIARNVYEIEGLKGLKERFSCVILNGNMI